MFVIRLHIVGLARKTEFRAFELWSPDWELNADVLTDPAERNSARTFYELLDKTTFDRSEVLNHRVGPDWILRHDSRMEGWLLAQCFSSAPTRYNKACPMPLIVSISNQFDDVHDLRLELKVEQTVTPIRLWPERRKGLFEPAKGPSSGPIEPQPDVRVRKTPSVGNGLPDTGRPQNGIQMYVARR